MDLSEKEAARQKYRSSQRHRRGRGGHGSVTVAAARPHLASNADRHSLVLEDPAALVLVSTSPLMQVSRGRCRCADQAGTGSGSGGPAGRGRDPGSHSLIQTQVCLVDTLVRSSKAYV